MRKLYLITILASLLPNCLRAQSVSINNVQVYSSASTYIDSVCVSISGNFQEFSGYYYIQYNDACGTIPINFNFKRCNTAPLTFLDTCINLGATFSQQIIILANLDTLSGCSNTNLTLKTDTFFWDHCTSLNIQNPKTKIQINIYPNPAKDQILLDVPDQIQLEGIELYSLNGKLVKRFNELERALNISEINTGLYFLRLRTEKEVITKKVVIE